MVKITNIVFSGTKACIELDNGDQLWLTKKDLADSFLKRGTEYDDDSFYEIIRLYQYPRALNQAVTMLARRPYSRNEIKKRLKIHKYSPDVCDLVLYKLEKERLINDIDFCDQWIQYRINHNYGPSRIRQELRSKGVEEKIIEDALSIQDETDYEEHSLKLAQKAWNSICSCKDQYKEKQKVIAFLVRKGYSWEQAKKAFFQAEQQIKKQHDDA